MRRVQNEAVRPLSSPPRPHLCSLRAAFDATSRTCPCPTPASPYPAQTAGSVASNACQSSRLPSLSRPRAHRPAEMSLPRSRLSSCYGVAGACNRQSASFSRRAAGQRRTDSPRLPQGCFRQGPIGAGLPTLRHASSKRNPKIGSRIFRLAILLAVPNSTYVLRGACVSQS